MKTWLVPDLEFYLIEALMNHALERLRQEHPQSMIRLIQDWLESTKPLYQQLGLRALLPLVENPQFENLPVFFRLVQPLACNVPPGLRPDLLDVLAALAHRSPQETAYFLRQTLSYPDAADTAWLIRQLLNEFPPEQQQMLHNAVKEKLPSRQLLSRTRSSDMLLACSPHFYLWYNRHTLTRPVSGCSVLAADLETC